MFRKFFPSKKYNPKPRWGHSTATIGSKMIIWGGTHSGLPEEHTSDLKTKLTSILEVFDVEKGTWAQETTVGQPPLGVRGHCSATLDTDIYYFGGYCGHDWCRHNTLHCLDTINNVWRLVEPTNSTRGPMKKSRCGIVGFTDNNKQYLCVFGGTGHLSSASQTNATYIPWKENPNWGWTNETHIFDFETGSWVTPIISGDVPPACAGFTLTRISANVAILCGGFQPQMGGCVSDVYIMKMSRNKIHWSKVLVGNEHGALLDDTTHEVDYHRPVGRQDHTSVCMTNSTLMIMGGRDPGGNTLNDCWLLDLNHNEWRQIFYLETIAYRHFHSTSVFHLSPSCLLVVVFGGVRGWVWGKSSKHQPAISATTIIEASDVSSEGCWDLRVVRDENDTSSSQEYHQLIEKYLTEETKVAQKKVMEIEVHIPSSTTPSETSLPSTPSSVTTNDNRLPLSIYEDIDPANENELQKHLVSKPQHDDSTDGRVSKPQHDDSTDGRVSRIDTRIGSPTQYDVDHRRGSPAQFDFDRRRGSPAQRDVDHRRGSPAQFDFDRRRGSPAQHDVDRRRSSPAQHHIADDRPPIPVKTTHRGSVDQVPPIPPKSPQHSLDGVSNKSSGTNETPPLPPKSLPNSFDQIPPLPSKSSKEDIAPPPPVRRSSLSLNKIPPALPPKAHGKLSTGRVPPLPPKIPLGDDLNAEPPPLPVKQHQRASPDDLDISGSTLDLARHNKHKPLVSSYVYSSAPSVHALNRSRRESIDQSINDISLLKNLRDNDRNIIQSLEQQLAVAISRSEEIEEQLHTAVVMAEERAVMAEEDMREMETQMNDVQEQISRYREALNEAQTKACLAYSEATDNSTDVLKLQQEVLMAEERAIAAEESVEKILKEKDDAIEDARKSYLMTSQMDAKIKEMERLMLKIEGEIQIAEDRVLEEKKANEQMKRKEVNQLLITGEYIEPALTHDDGITLEPDGDKTTSSFIKRSSVMYCCSRVTQLSFTDYIDDENDQWNILESLKPLAKLRHPNIVQFFGVTTNITECDEESTVTTSGTGSPGEANNTTVLSCHVNVMIDYLPTSLDQELRKPMGEKFTAQQASSISEDILSALVYLTTIDLYPFVKTKLRPIDVLLIKDASTSSFKAKLSFVEHIVLSASISDKLAVSTSITDLSIGSVIKDFGYILLSMIMGRPIQEEDGKTSTIGSDGNHQLTTVATKCIEDHTILNLNDIVADIHHIMQ